MVYGWFWGYLLSLFYVNEFPFTKKNVFGYKGRLLFVYTDQGWDKIKLKLNLLRFQIQMKIRTIMTSLSYLDRSPKILR